MGTLGEEGEFQTREEPDTLEGIKALKSLQEKEAVSDALIAYDVLNPLCGTCVLNMQFSCEALREKRAKDPKDCSKCADLKPPKNTTVTGFRSQRVTGFGVSSILGITALICNYLIN